MKNFFLKNRSLCCYFTLLLWSDYVALAILHDKTCCRIHLWCHSRWHHLGSRIKMVTFLLATLCLDCLSLIIYRKDYKMSNLNMVPFQLLDFSRVNLSSCMLVNQHRTRLKGYLSPCSWHYCWHSIYYLLPPS